MQKEHFNLWSCGTRDAPPSSPPHLHPSSSTDSLPYSPLQRLDYNQPFYPRLSMSLISIITQTLKSQYPPPPAERSNLRERARASASTSIGICTIRGREKRRKSLGLCVCCARTIYTICTIYMREGLEKERGCRESGEKRLAGDKGILFS